jgi:hypothetical protein
MHDISTTEWGGGGNQVKVKKNETPKKGGLNGDPKRVEDCASSEAPL